MTIYPAGTFSRGASFNRDPESSATNNLATCGQRCWQTAAGSAFGWRKGNALPAARLPAELLSYRHACDGNLALGPRLTATQSRLPRKTWRLADSPAGRRRRGARLGGATETRSPPRDCRQSLCRTATPVTATSLWVAVKRRPRVVCHEKPADLRTALLADGSGERVWVAQRKLAPRREIAGRAFVVPPRL